MLAASESELADEQRTKLLRVGIPALLLVLVVGSTLVLRPAWRIPASIVLVIISVVSVGLVSRDGDEPSAATAGVTARATLKEGGTLMLRIDPAAAGANDIVATVEEPETASTIVLMQLQAMPAGIKDVGPISLLMRDEGDGRFVLADATLPFSGTWDMWITYSRDSGDGQRLKVSTDIDAGP